MRNGNFYEQVNFLQAKIYIQSLLTVGRTIIGMYFVENEGSVYLRMTQSRFAN